MKLYIEAKWFDADPTGIELIGSWRGRALQMDGPRTLNFQLPLPKICSLERAEASTVYELLGTLPMITGPDDKVTIYVRSESTINEIRNTPTVNDQLSGTSLGDIEVEVFNADST